MPGVQGGVRHILQTGFTIVDPMLFSADESYMQTQLIWIWYILIEFNLVNMQGEGEGDEGSWHIHNAMRTEEGLFHPECHKDKDNGMDGSMVDTSMEETSSPVKKEVKEEKEKVVDANAESLPTCNDDTTSNELTSAAPAEETVIKTEPTVPSLADNDVPMEDVELKDEDAVAVKLEQKEDTDANDNNLDSKESVNEDNNVTTEEIKTEEVMDTETTPGEEPAEEGESEEKLKHSDSLLEENDKESLAVPVVPAKVVNISFDGGSDISCKITVNVSLIMSILNEKADGGNMFLISTLSLSPLPPVLCNTPSVGDVQIRALENLVAKKYNGQRR